MAGSVADPSDSGSGPAIGTRQLVQLALFVVVSTLVLAALHGVVPQVRDLYPLQLPPHPYFVPSHAWLLYVLTPLVVIASIALFAAPGILLVLAAGRTDHLGELVVKAFGAGLAWYVLATTGLKLLWGPLTSTSVLAVTLLGATLGWLALTLRVRRGDRVAWPFATPAGRRRLLWLLTIAVLLTCLLLPVLFWQDLNGDGWEELVFGRSLIESVLPLNTADNIISGAVGRVTMAYPVSWFAVLFGAGEGAVQLPFILDMLVLFGVLLALIEWQSPRRLKLGEEAVLVLGLGVYAVTVCYNASYDPYYADLNVAASETLPVLCMLAAFYFLWADQFRWFLLFAVAAYFGRPTALPLLLLFGLGVAIATRGKDTRRLLLIVSGIAACMLGMFLYQKLIIPWASGGTQVVESSFGVADRLAYLRLDDLSRLLFILVPSGILPALSLLAFRWQDAVGRSLTVVTVGYFLFFYVIAFVALHHFIPVMLLPLAIFWRLYLHQGDRLKIVARRWLVATAAAAAALAFWMSLPRHFEVDRTMRRLARSVDIRIDRQQLREAGRDPSLELQQVLFKLFPPGYAPVDPGEQLVIADGPILYYSKRSQGLSADINYIVQPSSAEPPAGFVEVGDTGFTSAYVRDIARWKADRFNPPRTDYRSPLYAIPRETLFRNLGRPAGNYTIDLAALVCDSPLRRWAGPDRCAAAGY